MPHLLRRAAAATTVLVASASIALLPLAAQAHSLDSSTVSVHVDESGADATITISTATLDQALGTNADALSARAYSDAVVAYLEQHVVVTGADGSAWAETWSPAAQTTVEGIDSTQVDVAFDTGGADPSAFTLDFDAVIEAVAGHEAVVVLTDAAGEVATAGVISSVGDTVTVGGAATGDTAGPLDMVGYGFHHVLDGADHLLFLLALLLPAPLVAVAGRWRPGGGMPPTARRVVGTVTAFTLGHSLTLVAAGLGWVSAPSVPVEVLIAVSVGVAAVHATRPLVRGGERVIAAAFGLVHGLAFAAILGDLGAAGTASIAALLAFNVGVELAGLLTVGLVFPSLYALSRTPAYPAVRLGGAALTLAAATGWALDRLGVLANPLAPLEDLAVTHPWPVVVVLALLAAAAHARRRRVARCGASSTRSRRTAPLGQISPEGPATTGRPTGVHED